MPENDFEKNAQQLFDGLKLKPSDEVWAHVHSRLQKDKRRRRFIVWVPSLFLLLLLGAGGYWMVKQENAPAVSTVTYPENPVTKNFSEQEKTGGNTTALNKDKTAETLKENSQLKAPVVKNDAPGQDNNIINKDSKETDHLSLKISETKDKQLVNTQAPDKNSNPAPYLKPVIKTSEQPHKPLQKESSLSAGATEKDIAKNGNENKTAPENSSISTAQETGSVTGYPQSVPYPLSLAGNVNGEPYIGNIPMALQTPVKLSKKKRWEWGIEAGAGVSKIGKGIADLLKTESDIDKLASDNLSLNTNYTNSGMTISNVTGQNNIYIAALAPAPSSLKPGPAWRAGLFVRLRVRERLSLSSGVMYNYFSTQREVGRIISPSQGFNQNQNTTNARYSATYTQQDGKNYTNKYHYITLPVGMEWQLNKGIKLPITLNAGANLSWMTATNALHYNANTGSYFEDKSRFNKFQAGIYTGLSVKLLQHSRHPVDIGPVFQYNLNDLIKSGSSKSQNMIYGGISARLVLWKQ